MVIQWSFYPHPHPWTEVLLNAIIDVKRILAVVVGHISLETGNPLVAGGGQWKPWLRTQAIATGWSKTDQQEDVHGK